MRLLMRRSGVMLNPRMARLGTVSARNKSCYFKDLRGLEFAQQHQDDQHDQNHAAEAHSGMAETIAIAAKTAGEPAQEENDQDDDEYRAQRHGSLLKARQAPGKTPRGPEQSTFRAASPRSAERGHRHCERSEAIHARHAKKGWIASLRSLAQTLRVCRRQ